jgi:GNAT superfamily N-acetyltransferase
MIELLDPDGDDLRWAAAEQLLTEALHGSTWNILHPVDAEVTDTLTAARAVPDQLAMLASVGGSPAGVLFAELRRERMVAFVRWVAVHPSYRRQGIASRLVEHLQGRPGLERLEGMVDRDDPAASAFWAAHGWAPLHRPPARIRMGRSLAAGVSAS